MSFVGFYQPTLHRIYNCGSWILKSCGDFHRLSCFLLSWVSQCSVMACCSDARTLKYRALFYTFSWKTSWFAQSTHSCRCSMRRTTWSCLSWRWTWRLMTSTCSSTPQLETCKRWCCWWSSRSPKPCNRSVDKSCSKQPSTVVLSYSWALFCLFRLAPSLFNKVGFL